MKTGNIYVIGSFEHLELVKIGITRDACEIRLNQLQTGNPFLLHAWASMPIDMRNLMRCEKNIHSSLEGFKKRGEWFNLHPRIAIETVKSHISSFEIKRTKRSSKQETNQ